MIEVQKMIDAIDDHNKLRSDANEKIKVSLELEKSRPELLSLFHRADVVSCVVACWSCRLSIVCRVVCQCCLSTLFVNVVRQCCLLVLSVSVVC